MGAQAIRNQPQAEAESSTRQEAMEKFEEVLDEWSLFKINIESRKEASLEELLACNDNLEELVIKLDVKYNELNDDEKTEDYKSVRNDMFQNRRKLKDQIRKLKSEKLYQKEDKPTTSTRKEMEPSTKEAKNSTNEKVNVLMSTQNQKAIFTPICACCNHKHWTSRCRIFKTFEERIEQLVKNRRCLNCLKQGHLAKNCKKERKTCTTCKGQHNRVLCRSSKEAAETKKKPDDEVIAKKSKQKEIQISEGREELLKQCSEFINVQFKQFVDQMNKILRFNKFKDKIRKEMEELITTVKAQVPAINTNSTSRTTTDESTHHPFKRWSLGVTSILR